MRGPLVEHHFREAMGCLRCTRGAAGSLLTSWPPPSPPIGPEGAVVAPPLAASASGTRFAPHSRLRCLPLPAPTGSAGDAFRDATQASGADRDQFWRRRAPRSTACECLKWLQYCVLAGKCATGCDCVSVERQPRCICGAPRMLSHGSECLPARSLQASPTAFFCPSSVHAHVTCGRALMSLAEPTGHVHARA